MHQRVTACLAVAAMAAMPASAREAKVEEVSIEQLQAAMAQGRNTSEEITRAYLARIAAMDRRGPTLRSIIALNPHALRQARALDAERSAGHVRGPLHGIPVLIKDNIETRDPVATTAGSLALRANVTRRDAPLVANLRRAGAVILGKTNLSEWANIRSTHAISGWSAVGGLVRNPYALDRSACGSSSGSGAAVAASFAAVAVGTETDGSIVCPSSVNGLVGFKPTLGLVSRTHVVPISHSQDTPGPMARTVRDVAILLSAMAGPDPADLATTRTVVTNYAAGLSTTALSGVRVAVLRPGDLRVELAERYEAALAVLRAAGAILVDVEPLQLDGLGDAELVVLKTELKVDLNNYLSTVPAAVEARTLSQLIRFNRSAAPAEMPLFGQELFELAEATRGYDDPSYIEARRRSARRAGPERIDLMLRTAHARILVEPSYGTAWLSDPVHGDQDDGPSASALPAVAGYPHLTVPMGLIHGLPVGLSFIATKLDDAMLLGAGFAFEQRAKARSRPRYLMSVDVGSSNDGAG